MKRSILALMVFSLAAYGFEVAKEGYFKLPVGARVEMRDGKIAKEIVFDMGHPVAAATGRKAT